MVSEKAINCPQCGNPISNISALSSESKPNFEKSNSGCFYCKIHEADQKKSFSKKIYKLTGVSELIIGRGSNFLIKNVEIPRCRYCCKKHENFYFYVYIPIFITSIILIARFLFYDVGGWNWTWAIIGSVMFSFFCAAGITFILSLLLFRLIFGIPLDDNVNDHPIVVSLVENGWRIKSFEEFRRCTEQKHEDKRIVLFRGQKEIWPLFPRLIRTVIEKKRLYEFYDIERQILKEFCELSLQFDSKIKDFNDWDILALAQHFGLPTRLLDWTSNPLTALWFAFESEKDNNNDRIVWGLIVEDDFPIDIEKDSPFHRRYIKVFKPRNEDERIIAQQSWLAVWNIQLFGDGGNDLLPEPNIVEAMDELEEFEYHLAKFIIPNSLRTEILNNLESIGINYFSLFPDLAGLCKNLDWREFR